MTISGEGEDQQGTKEATQEALRALDLAEGYLEDAENVLWTTAAEIEPEDTATELENLTDTIWDLQLQLSELQDQLDE